MGEAQIPQRRAIAAVPPASRLHSESLVTLPTPGCRFQLASKTKKPQCDRKVQAGLNVASGAMSLDCGNA
jgi:hypothetical protein